MRDEAFQERGIPDISSKEIKQVRVSGDDVEVEALLGYPANSQVQVVREQLEASLRDAQPGTHYQFERVGYFYVDPVDSKPKAPVFNRTVTLRDSWAKIEKRGED